MEELELNYENLLSLGLTPEIIKNDFENWIIENKDIQIDFNNKCESRVEKIDKIRKKYLAKN